MAEQNKSNPKLTFEQAIIEACWKDEAFRQQLLKDPKAAIKASFGIEIGSINLKVIEEGPNEMILTIPAKPEGVSGELSVEELDSVAAAGTHGCYNTAHVWHTCGCHYTEAWDYTCRLNPNHGCGHHYTTLAHGEE